MSIYHLCAKIIGRGSGKSAVAAAAYRSGEKLHDEYVGIDFDYRKKRGIAYSEIFLCKNAPEEYRNRETLWNEVQNIEKQKDAQYAREIEVAIPHELSWEDGIVVVREFANKLVEDGMCVDLNIHNNKNNRHVHMQMPLRSIKEDGSWAPKSRKVYDLDEAGDKIPLIDKKTGKQKVDNRNCKQWKNHKEDYNDWNQKYKLDEWRKAWEECCNKYLSKESQIDHRSYKDQEIDLIPTIHEGYYARKIERQGGVSELCEINRNIKKRNELNKQINKTENEIESDKTKLQEIQEEINNDRNELENAIRAGRAESRELETAIWRGKAESRELETAIWRGEAESRELETTIRDGEEESRRLEMAVRDGEESERIIGKNGELLSWLEVFNDSGTDSFRGRLEEVARQRASEIAEGEVEREVTGDYGQRITESVRSRITGFIRSRITEIFSTVGEKIDGIRGRFIEHRTGYFRSANAAKRKGIIKRVPRSFVIEDVPEKNREEFWRIIGSNQFKNNMDAAPFIRDFLLMGNAILDAKEIWSLRLNWVKSRECMMHGYAEWDNIHGRLRITWNGQQYREYDFVEMYLQFSARYSLSSYIPEDVSRYIQYQFPGIHQDLGHHQDLDELQRSGRSR